MVNMCGESDVDETPDYVENQKNIKNDINPDIFTNKLPLQPLSSKCHKDFNE